MVHSNPYFKYPKEVKSKMPSRKRKIKNPKEKEGNVLFLNKGPATGKKTPYRAKALSRVKSELLNLRNNPAHRSKLSERSGNTVSNLPRIGSLKSNLKSKG